MAMKGVRGAPGGRGQKSKTEESKGSQQGGGLPQPPSLPLWLCLRTALGPCRSPG